MPVTNINRNRKHFVREILDEEKGEQILGGSADGEVRVIPRYHAFYANENAKDPKAYHMTLFPTNRRVVAYQSNGFLHRDKYAQLPIAEIEAITYCEIQDKKKVACVTEFVAPDESRYPSIVFKMDCSGHPDDLEQYKVILRGIAKLAGVPVDDYTQEGNGIASNIYVVKDDVEPVKPAYIATDEIDAYAEAHAAVEPVVRTGSTSVAEPMPAPEETFNSFEPAFDMSFGEQAYDDAMPQVSNIPSHQSEPMPQPRPQRSSGRLKSQVRKTNSGSGQQARPSDTVRQPNRAQQARQAQPADRQPRQQQRQSIQQQRAQQAPAQQQQQQRKSALKSALKNKKQ